MSNLYVHIVLLLCPVRIHIRIPNAALYNWFGPGTASARHYCMRCVQQQFIEGWVLWPKRVLDHQVRDREAWASGLVVLHGGRSLPFPLGAILSQLLKGHSKIFQILQYFIYLRFATIFKQIKLFHNGVSNGKKTWEKQTHEFYCCQVLSSTTLRSPADLQKNGYTYGVWQIPAEQQDDRIEESPQHESEDAL